MKHLKIFLIALGLMILGFGVIYMCGAFYNATFNIRCWTEDSRASVSIIGGIIGIFAAAIFIFFTTVEE